MYNKRTRKYENEKFHYYQANVSKKLFYICLMLSIAHLRLCRTRRGMEHSASPSPSTLMGSISLASRSVTPSPLKRPPPPPSRAPAPKKQRTEELFLLLLEEKLKYCKKKNEELDRKNMERKKNEREKKKRGPSK